jgi:hypothetical protein
MSIQNIIFRSVQLLLLSKEIDRLLPHPNYKKSNQKEFNIN